MQSQIHFFQTSKNSSLVYSAGTEKWFGDSDRHKRYSCQKFTHGRTSIFNSIKYPRLFIYISFLGYFSLHQVASGLFQHLPLFPPPPFFLILFLQCTITHPSSLLQTSVSPSEYNTQYFFSPSISSKLW